jgi:hypothetical protein
MIVAGLLACLLAAALLLDIRRVFYTDWNNHLWVMEYFGECIRRLTIPDVINTRQLVGMVDQLFYAQKFYVFSGLFSAFLGSAISIRGLVFTVLFMQFLHVYRAAQKAGSHRTTAICIAVMVTWAIYPLTNLYNRNALTEFFSIIFLTCSAASFLGVILATKQEASKYDVISTGLFFVLAALTHPLTALFGGAFLFILGLLALIFCAKDRKVWLLIFFSRTALMSLLTLSPWIYLLHQFKDKLLFSSASSNAGNFRGGWFYPGSIDNIWSRLSPLPLDLRAIQKGVQDVSTPYLDAQIIVPAVLLIVVFICIGLGKKSEGDSLNACERAILCGAAIMMIVAFAVSVYPNISGWAGGIFDILQFPYRLTSYVNLSAIVILIILAGRVSRANSHSRPVINICLAFCMALSFSALMLKLVHAAAISTESTEKKVWIDNTLKTSQGAWMPCPVRSTARLNELPPTYYGWPYSVEDVFLKESSLDTVAMSHRDFNVLEGDRFGQVEALALDLDRPTLVITNVEPFPWNQIVVDGIARPSSETFVAGHREAVLLAAGRHQLAFVTRTDAVWRNLNLLSWGLLIGWLALYAACVFIKIRQWVCV